MSEYKKRSGSTLREYNINVVIEKLRQGMNETDVLNELAMAFCPDTRIDYLNIAKEKLKMEKSETSQPQNNSVKPVKEEKPQIEQKEESATEYMQRKTKEENKRDFSLDLYNFIKINNYENLSDSELIEKINIEIKNEKLKANWIKQIKEGSKND
jgi:IMP dehydrogenase/GMP reductase